MKRLVPLLALTLAASAADFPAPFDTEPSTDAPLQPAEAAARWQLPDGMKATVFAAEPDVQNPIAMAWDGRGRLWIAENYTYAEGGVRYELKLRDRVLIFEDKDGDGRFDERRVFTDQLQLLTSIEPGCGGVFALALPHLVFLPDRDGDDVPDGPAEVLLEGFNPPQENHHNIASGLRFGPDGWLYGRCGASGPAEIGAPGTPAAQRISVRGGMWRYHPQRRVFEAITSGNTNPWGHDWNEHGELFYVNTVNGHLWHAVAGEHFVRAHTIDPNPRTYALIDQHADHWHFDTGKSWQDSRAGAANALGGGHSHIGAMIYLGDQWPAEMRGRFFTLNQHGRRANQELLERRGSGYVARHGRDTLISADPWFVGLDLSYGPDGGVYVLDWSDTGECHERTGVHRTSGRIYKITHGEPAKVAAFDLRRASEAELVGHHAHANEWFSRQARKELVRRAAAGDALATARQRLRELCERPPTAALEEQLRAFWTLGALGGLDDTLLRAQLRHPDEHVRAWAVRFLSDAWPLDTLHSVRPEWQPGFAAAEEAARRWSGDLATLAQGDPSGLVRLALASALQRLPIAERPALAGALLTRAEDATDHNLPLLIWYGLIALADRDPAALAQLGARCLLPQTRQFIARRLAEDLERNPQPLDQLLRAPAVRTDTAFFLPIATGIAEALSGWRKAPKPATWDELAMAFADSPDPTLRDRLRELSVVFGDGRALDEVKRVALDKKAQLTQRKAALQTLIDSRSPETRAICEQLLSERFLNPVAARGLAGFDDPAVARRLVDAYRQFHPTERALLLGTLVSRPTFARALLAAVQAGKIPRSEITPFHARQMRSFHDDALDRDLTAVWGEVRESAGDQRQLIARWRAALTTDALAQADKSAGRKVFAQTCAACHRLYGEGGEVGPDLTGSGRANLDYLLENILDPNAVVPADFRMTVLTMKDGRVLNGFVATQSERTLTLRTMTEKLTVDRSEIARTDQLAQSLMPEGLLLALTEAQVRELFAYLMHPTQVP